MTLKRQVPYTEAPDNERTCQRVTDLIIDYLTEALEPAMRAAFAVHLHNCPDCIAFLQTYKQTVRVTRTLRYENIPAEMLARVQQFPHKRITETLGLR